MTEDDIPAGAKVTATPALRFKPMTRGRKTVPVLQQCFRIESDKTLFYLWRPVPEVAAGAED